MRRENRRVAAMSWGAGDDMPPPKPARIPHNGNYKRRISFNANLFTKHFSIVAFQMPPHRSVWMGKDRLKPT